MSEISKPLRFPKRKRNVVREPGWRCCPYSTGRAECASLPSRLSALLSNRLWGVGGPEYVGPSLDISIRNKEGGYYRDCRLFEASSRYFGRDFISVSGAISIDYSFGQASSHSLGEDYLRERRNWFKPAYGITAVAAALFGFIPRQALY